MQFLIKIPSLLLLASLVVSPIFILKRLNKTTSKYKLVSYLSIEIVLTALILLLFSYWSYTSDKLLLTHYGYTIDGTSDIERYGNVSPENVERVKKLRLSVTGIGWSLKALMIVELYWPYFAAIYLGIYFLPKIIRSFSEKI